MIISQSYSKEYIINKKPVSEPLSIIAKTYTSGQKVTHLPSVVSSSSFTIFTSEKLQIPPLELNQADKFTLTSHPLPSLISISTSTVSLCEKVSVSPLIFEFTLKISTNLEESKDFMRHRDYDARSSYSFVSGMETPLTTTTMQSFEDGFELEPTEGYMCDRFLGEIDDFFKCPVCKQVVKKPKECSTCQNLICKYCSYSQIKCPYGCEDFILHRPSKFALLVYHRLKLKCAYYESGCDFVGRIKDMRDHELLCLYEVIKCQSPICCTTFIKKEKHQGEGVPLVCSDMCRAIVDFKETLDHSSREVILTDFSHYLVKMADIPEEEINKELVDVLAEKERKQEEAQQFLTRKNNLLSELESRRTKNHPGKWNIPAKKWTCCDNADKYSIGCRE